MMPAVPSSAWASIEWKMPPADLRDRAEAGARPSALSETRREAASPVGSLRAAVEAYGIPFVPGATPLEEACIMLRAAAEVEHAVLVEYLYAAYSLGAHPLEDKVKTIVIQEMFHLLAVQNLLLFAGARPWLRRQDQDSKPDEVPFQFSLRPFSKVVLEDFILAEMPPLDDMTPDERSIVEPLSRQREKEGRQVHRVGVIYSLIYWLFQPDDKPTADWPEVASVGYDSGRHVGDFPGAATAGTLQLDPSAEPLWPQSDPHGGIFAKVASRAEALNAVFRIASQGEGLVASSADQTSHFLAFLDMYRSTDFGALPSANWPTDPFVSNVPDPNPQRESSRLTNPDAVALSAILDNRYQIALTCIRAALSRDKSNKADEPIRAKYLRWLFDEMLSSMKPLSLGLADFPLKAAGAKSGSVAAPTFGLAGFQLPDDPAALDVVMQKLHTSAAALIAAAQAQIQDAETKRLLRALQTIDKKRFPSLIA